MHLLWLIFPQHEPIRIYQSYFNQGVIVGISFVKSSNFFCKCMKSALKNKFSSHPTHSLYHEPRFPFITSCPNYYKVKYLYRSKIKIRITSQRVQFGLLVVFIAKIQPNISWNLDCHTAADVLHNTNLCDLTRKSLRNVLNILLFQSICSFLFAAAPGNIWNQGHMEFTGMLINCAEL